MNTLVVDSSVIVKWLNQTREESLEQADKILAQARNNEIRLIAPELAKYEVGNVLITKGVSALDAQTALTTLYLIPITFITESLDLALETYLLSDSLKVTYYDASFLSLANQYNASLVTENVKHQGKDTDVIVIPLKDY